MYQRSYFPSFHKVVSKRDHEKDKFSNISSNFHPYVDHGVYNVMKQSIM